jgi:hypothetical protein
MSIFVIYYEITRQKLTHSFHESESLQASCMQANVYLTQYWCSVLIKEQHVRSEVIGSLRFQCVLWIGSQSLYNAWLARENDRTQRAVNSVSRVGELFSHS